MTTLVSAAFDNYLTKSGVGPSEKKVIGENLFSASKVFVQGNKERAVSTAENSKLDGLEDGPADALRHSYFNALNTRTAGEEFAKEQGDAHKKDSKSRSPNAVKMDLHNNAVGIQVAKDHPYASTLKLANILVDKIVKGELMVLDKKGNLVKSSLTPKKAEESKKNIYSGL